jgi:hypothetical protein
MSGTPFYLEKQAFLRIHDMADDGFSSRKVKRVAPFPDGLRFVRL